MRAPHFLLAALVALATSFSLHAVARHRYYAGGPGYSHGRHRGAWAHRGPRFGPGACELPAGAANQYRRDAGPTPLPNPGPDANPPATR